MPKNHDKPKRSLCAYMFFCNDKRPEVVKESPDLKVAEIGKRLGEMWRNLSDEEKEPYKQKAIQDKKRYQDELAKMSGSKSNSDDSD